MKKQFEMTEEEFNELREIAQRPSMPVLKIGSVITGSEKQDAANAAWKKLSKKYGFVWDSAEGAGSNPKRFLAIPFNQ